ncbi:gastric inhibitory polypeptide receptor [Erpetoichthys calabaricus]|uniref:gastric inhibitory polypeptide receptor n=1 Tax=Erpetoichthys calabaricus TaxID=27687 RepID=UPI0022349F47|nr:gastric inhibitory polypeptide receptor [Erpetoichthys calabaricus]
MAADKATKHIVEQWKKYHWECLLRMSTEPYPPGLFCNRTFDMYVCWTDGEPNTTVKVPCPWYLPWYDQVKSGFVFRKCGADGQWVTNNSDVPWRDHSQCQPDDNGNQSEQEQKIWILAQFQLMYTVGYSLSLAALVLALSILLAFRKLRCTRNYIHMNLFASFILRAGSILTRDSLLKRQMEFTDGELPGLLSDQELLGCRLAQILMQYCVEANYSWLLVEGVYLHNLLVLMASTEKKSCFWSYLLIGWGSPVLFVVPWILMRYFYENEKCWEKNEVLAHWWIIRSPILVAVLVNFFIFLRIIKILVSKLRAQQMRYTDSKFRLAKSTLTLIPLLGIHELVAFFTEENVQGTVRYLKLFFELFLNSFQGFIVAVLYCFFNREVQSEIKKKWQRHKLGMSLLEEQRHTFSQMPNEAANTGRWLRQQPITWQQPCDRASSVCSSENSFSTHYKHTEGKRIKLYRNVTILKQEPHGTEGEVNRSLKATYMESYC